MKKLSIYVVIRILRKKEFFQICLILYRFVPRIRCLNPNKLTQINENKITYFQNKKTFRMTHLPHLVVRSETKKKQKRTAQ